MRTLTVSGHVEQDTAFRVRPFPNQAHPFVSLEVEGTDITISLLASTGSADALRSLAAAAAEAATTLDTLTADIDHRAAEHD
ncbi:hypothetical protein ACFVAM_20125 [Streptomyces californicus]|uniref:hypothetical protein n=1 Tax=Streptomyces californicus TaxID=67351 RepID=UPI003697276D